MCTDMLYVAPALGRHIGDRRSREGAMSGRIAGCAEGRSPVGMSRAVRSLGVLCTATVFCVLASSPLAAAARPTWQQAQQRASVLVAQMTLDEKISMVHGDQALPINAAGHV